jgi:hypothetical protein
LILGNTVTGPSANAYLEKIRFEQVKYLLATEDEPYESELSRFERLGSSGFMESRGGGVDPYDNGQKGFRATAESAKTMTDQQVNRALEALREDELKRTGVYPQSVPFESARKGAERRDERGSFEKLRMACGRLRIEKGDALQRDEKVRWLAENIPGPIRIPPEAWRERRATFAPLVRGLFNEYGRHSDVRRAIGIPKPELEKMLTMTRAAA